MKHALETAIEETADLRRQIDQLDECLSTLECKVEKYPFEKSSEADIEAIRQ